MPRCTLMLRIELNANRLRRLKTSFLLTQGDIQRLTSFQHF
jgi:hypothetical protein